jgi:hypothetical protein
LCYSQGFVNDAARFEKNPYERCKRSAADRSKNPYNNDTISRKDFHYIFDKSILRDYTPNTYYYLAGLIDGDGYLGKNYIEITLHAKEIDVLYRVKALFNGTVSMKTENSCR